MTDHGPQAPLGAERRAHVMAALGRDGVVRISQLIDELGVAPGHPPPRPGADGAGGPARARARRRGAAQATGVPTARRGRRRHRRRRGFDRGARALAQLLLAGSRARRRGRGEAAAAWESCCAERRTSCRTSGRCSSASCTPTTCAASSSRPTPTRRTRRTSCSGSPTAARPSVLVERDAVLLPGRHAGRVGDDRPRARRRARRAAPRLPRPPQGGPDHLARLADLAQDHARAGRRPAPSSD